MKVPKITHTSILFNRLNLLKFKDIVKFKTYIIAYKAYNNQLPVMLQQHFIKKNNPHNMRNKYNFTLPKISRRKFELSTNIQAIKLWNDLPNTVKMCPTLSKFKMVIKSNMIATYIN